MFDEIKPGVQIVRPDKIHERSFMEAFRESESDEDRFALVYLGSESYSKFSTMTFSEYVSLLLEREHTAPAGFVTDSIYWGIFEGEVVGRISMRHELNEFLKVLGGHIGYYVKPSARRKGAATQMLREILQTERALKIKSLLLTCDEDNVASAKTILKVGGVLESLIEYDPNKPKKKRFWINL